MKLVACHGVVGTCREPADKLVKNMLVATCRELVGDKQKRLYLNTLGGFLQTCRACRETTSANAPNNSMKSMLVACRNLSLLRRGCRARQAQPPTVDGRAVGKIETARKRNLKLIGGAKWCCPASRATRGQIVLRLLDDRKSGVRP